MCDLHPHAFGAAGRPLASPGWLRGYPATSGVVPPRMNGAAGWIRTTVARRREVYSLLQLAALPRLHVLSVGAVLIQRVPTPRVTVTHRSSLTPATHLRAGLSLVPPEGFAPPTPAPSTRRSTAELQRQGWGRLAISRTRCHHPHVLAAVLGLEPRNYWVTTRLRADCYTATECGSHGWI